MAQGARPRAVLEVATPRRRGAAPTEGARRVAVVTLVLASFIAASTRLPAFCAPAQTPAAAPEEVPVGETAEKGSRRHQELVDKVKSITRIEAEAWDGYVGHKRYHKYKFSSQVLDPARHSSKFLQGFVSSYDRGERFTPAWKLLEDLLLVVPQLDVAWKKHLLSEVESASRKEMKQDSSFVARFLRKLAKAGAGDDKTNKEVRVMVAKLKGLKGEAWSAWCSHVQRSGFEDRDPARYPASFVKSFFQTQPAWAPEREAALARVHEVIGAKQDEWRSFAKSRADEKGSVGNFDPEFHTTASLEEFLSQIAEEA